MFVCLCKGVSDKKIRSLLESGVSTVQGLMRSCQAGRDCGSCICVLKDMVERSRQSQAAESADDVR
jgi:bacterioferritin-associated ferredoxin